MEKTKAEGLELLKQGRTISKAAWVAQRLIEKPGEARMNFT
ncbi:hypothetical protein [Rhodoferax sp.]|nr:hypothetical protein [Rhodoferax sp.]